MLKVLRFAVGMLLCASPALAQQAPGAPAAPPPAATAPAGPTLQLSMEEAVSMALETNLGLKADRLDVNIAAETVRLARANFKPVLRSAFNRSVSDSASGSAFEGTSGAVISRGGTSVNSSLSQNIPWLGGNYNVFWNSNRNTTTQEFSAFNPTLGSTVGFGITQPLLRNFRIDSMRASLESAERGRQIADLGLEQRVIATRSSVQLAYLGLIGALEQLKVANQNMALAQESLRQFRQRVAVGVSAEIEVIQQEASVAREEESVVVAEAQIDTAMDNLRALILDPARPDYWQVRLQPSDAITAVAREVDVDAAIRNALANRLDLQALRRQQEITSLNLRLSENQIKPSLDFNLGYSSTGTGGTLFEYDRDSGVFPFPISNRINRPFGTVLSEAFGGTYPSWNMSAVFSYPLGHNAAKAQLVRARLEKQQEDLTLQNLELQVATQVRNAVRDVQMNRKRVEVTQKALQATERQLEAERRKFDVGLSSAFERQTREQQLANARIVELRAMIDYNEALIRLERVQRVP